MCPSISFRHRKGGRNGNELLIHKNSCFSQIRRKKNPDGQDIGIEEEERERGREKERERERERERGGDG